MAGLSACPANRSLIGFLPLVRLNKITDASLEEVFLHFYEPQQEPSALARAK